MPLYVALFPIQILNPSIDDAPIPSALLKTVPPKKVLDTPKSKLHHGFSSRSVCANPSSIKFVLIPSTALDALRPEAVDDWVAAHALLPDAPQDRARFGYVYVPGAHITQDDKLDEPLPDANFPATQLVHSRDPG
jgi:hypothetical protein